MSTAGGYRIEMPRLILRTAIPSDAAFLVALHSDPADAELKVWKSAETSVERYEQKTREWRASSERGENGFMCILLKIPETDDTNHDFLADDGALIGFSGFNVIIRRTDHSDAGAPIETVDVGILVAPTYRGRGYSKEAMTGLIDYAFLALQPRNVVLDTQAANAPFRSFMRSLGLGHVERERFSEKDGQEASYDFDREQWEAAKRSVTRR